jgi:hypothetical protein
MDKSMSASAGLVDRSLAEEALALARPFLERAVTTTRFGDSGALHVVVLDPRARAGSGAFEEAILAEASFGDVARWDWDYQGAARAKAKLAWEHGRDAEAVVRLAPHRLARGDVLLGGAVCLDGIVVGASGAQPWFDEALALSVAGVVRALAKERASKLSGPYLE